MECGMVTEARCYTFIAFLFCESAKQKARRPRKHEAS